jgi:hypothetical protein
MRDALTPEHILGGIAGLRITLATEDKRGGGRYASVTEHSDNDTVRPPEPAQL